MKSNINSRPLESISIIGNDIRNVREIVRLE